MTAKGSAAAEGDTYENTTSNVVRYYNGTDWVNITTTFRPAESFANVGIEAATTTNANDSIKITSADGTALSTANAIQSTMQGATPGQIDELSLTADVTMDLTGLTNGVTVDLTDAVLHVYFVNDAGTLKVAVGQDGGRNLILGTEDSTTPSDINTASEFLVNSALGADSQAVHIGYFKANFDHTGGAAEALWSVQTGDQDIGVGVHPQLDSEIFLLNSNDQGSTNTMVERWSETITNTGSAITYTDSATLGATFTVNEHGLYSGHYTYQKNADSDNGISLNGTQLTTNIASITNGEEAIGISSQTSAERQGFMGWSRMLNIGDIVRGHGDGSNAGANPQRQTWQIMKAGNG